MVSHQRFCCSRIIKQMACSPVSWFAALTEPMWLFKSQKQLWTMVLNAPPNLPKILAWYDQATVGWALTLGNELTDSASDSRHHCACVIHLHADAKKIATLPLTSTLYMQAIHITVMVISVMTSKSIVIYKPHVITILVQHISTYLYMNVIQALDFSLKVYTRGCPIIVPFVWTALSTAFFIKGLCQNTALSLPHLSEQPWTQPSH